MILPPTSKTSHHHKVTNITMSSTSLSPSLSHGIHPAPYLGSVTVLNGMFCCSICCNGFDYILLFLKNQVRFHFPSFDIQINKAIGNGLKSDSTTRQKNFQFQLESLCFHIHHSCFCQVLRAIWRNDLSLWYGFYLFYHMDFICIFRRC